MPILYAPYSHLSVQILLSCGSGLGRVLSSDVIIKCMFYCLLSLSYQQEKSGAMEPVLRGVWGLVFVLKDKMLPLRPISLL